jgi:hypothetical protein
LENVAEGDTNAQKLVKAAASREGTRIAQEN